MRRARGAPLRANERLVSTVTTKTVLYVGVAAGIAYVLWAVFRLAGPEPASGPTGSPVNAARPPNVRPGQQQAVATTGDGNAHDELRHPHEAQPIPDADQAPPSKLERAQARLDRITTKMRHAREDLSSLTDQERRALFAEGMAAYDSMQAQARLEGPEAKAELEALYPEFRELMLAVKPPPPGVHEAAGDDG